MALIKCPECGREISDKAGACPGCGCPASEFKTICKSIVDQEDGNVNTEPKEPKCPYCSSRDIDEEGYCNECGMKISVYSENSAKKKSAVVDFDRIADELFEKYPFEQVKAIKELREKTGLDLKTARDMMYIRYRGKTATELERDRKLEAKEKRRRANENLRTSLNTLANLTAKDKTARCPKCGSTSITYIQKKSGFFGVEIMDGVFAGSSSSKGRCKCLKCGKEWKK